MAKKSPFLLSTTDNKYSPFSQFIEWYIEDQRLGYDTPGLLARMTAEADEFNDNATEQAMRDIITLNFSGKHVMVFEGDYDS
jgi:hypothetical protein